MIAWNELSTAGRLGRRGFWLRNALALQTQRNSENPKWVVATDTFGNPAANPGELIQRLPGISTDIEWGIAGSNSITMSQSTAAGGPNTVWVQHPAWITTATQSSMDSGWK